jgi:hypothetical protein
MMYFVEFHNLHCLSDTGVSKKICRIVEKCGMNGSEGNLEQIFDWETGRKESIQKACVNMGG